MSVQNIVNITEANLQQTLEQSMTKPVLFYFWSERSQHCLQLTPVWKALPRSTTVSSFWRSWIVTPNRWWLPSLACVRSQPSTCSRTVSWWMASRPQPEEAIRALLDKVLPREEELKAQEAMALMQEGKYDEALPLLKDAWQLSNQNSQIGLLLAETQIALHRPEDAEAVLENGADAGSGHPLSGSGGAD